MFEHIQEIREQVKGDKIVVSLSLGKDSVACLALCSMVFDEIYCMVASMLPGRKSDLEYAAYLRKMFPKIRDVRFYPHPVFLDFLSKKMYQPHTAFQDPFFKNGGYEEEWEYGYSFESLVANLLLENGLDPTEIYTAVGSKAGDTIDRAITLRKYGCVNHKHRKVYPLKDWADKTVFQFLKYKGIRLHPDYKFYGSSFDAKSPKFWVNAFRKDKETWNLLEAYYPLARTYIYRDMFKRRMAQNESK